MKSPDQIAKQAAKIVLKENHLGRAEGEDPLAALCWAMGNGIDYEEALNQLVGRAIELDRAQRADIAKSLKKALKRFDARKDGSEDDLIYTANLAVRFLQA